MNSFIFNNFKNRFLKGNVPKEFGIKLLSVNSKINDIENLQYARTIDDINKLYFQKTNQTAIDPDSNYYGDIISNINYNKLTYSLMEYSTETEDIYRPTYVTADNWDKFIELYPGLDYLYEMFISNTGSIYYRNGGFYFILTRENLQWCADRVNGKIGFNNNIAIVLGDNIGATEIQEISLCIGIDKAHKFEGVFFGNNYTLQNLEYSYDSDNSGIIGILGENGIISNLFISGNIILNCKTNLSIDHVKKGKSNVYSSLICGKNYGKIFNIESNANFIFKNFIPDVYISTNRSNNQPEDRFGNDENKYYPKYMCFDNVGNVIPYFGYFNDGVMCSNGQNLIVNSYNTIEREFCSVQTSAYGKFWNDYELLLDNISASEIGHGDIITSSDDDSNVNYAACRFIGYNDDNMLSGTWYQDNFTKLHNNARVAYYTSPIIGFNSGIVSSIYTDQTLTTSGTFVGFIGGVIGHQVQGIVTDVVTNNTFSSDYKTNSATFNGYDDYTTTSYRTLNSNIFTIDDDTHNVHTSARSLNRIDCFSDDDVYSNKYIALDNSVHFAKLKVEMAMDSQNVATTLNSFTVMSADSLDNFKKYVDKQYNQAAVSYEEFSDVVNPFLSDIQDIEIMREVSGYNSTTSADTGYINGEIISESGSYRPINNMKFDLNTIFNSGSSLSSVYSLINKLYLEISVKHSVTETDVNNIIYSSTYDEEYNGIDLAKVKSYSSTNGSAYYIADNFTYIIENNLNNTQYAITVPNTGVSGIYDEIDTYKITLQSHDDPGSPGFNNIYFGTNINGEPIEANNFRAIISNPIFSNSGIIGFKELQLYFSAVNSEFIFSGNTATANLNLGFAEFTIKSTSSVYANISEGIFYTTSVDQDPVYEINQTPCKLRFDHVSSYVESGFQMITADAGLLYPEQKYTLYPSYVNYPLIYNEASIFNVGGLAGKISLGNWQKIYNTSSHLHNTYSAFDNENEYKTSYGLCNRYAGLASIMEIPSDCITDKIFNTSGENLDTTQTYVSNIFDSSANYVVIKNDDRNLRLDSDINSRVSAYLHGLSSPLISEIIPICRILPTVTKYSNGIYSNLDSSQKRTYFKPVLSGSVGLYNTDIPIQASERNPDGTCVLINEDLPGYKVSRGSSAYMINAANGIETADFYLYENKDQQFYPEDGSLNLEKFVSGFRVHYERLLVPFKFIDIPYPKKANSITAWSDEYFENKSISRYDYMLSDIKYAEYLGVTLDLDFARPQVSFIQPSLLDTQTYKFKNRPIFNLTKIPSFTAKDVPSTDNVFYYEYTKEPNFTTSSYVNRNVAYFSGNDANNKGYYITNNSLGLSSNGFDYDGTVFNIGFDLSPRQIRTSVSNSPSGYFETSSFDSNDLQGLLVIDDNDELINYVELNYSEVDNFALALSMPSAVSGSNVIGEFINISAIYK